MSIRTGDERDFVNKAPFDKENMSRYRKNFRDYIKSDIHSQFDVGYFMAWADYVQYQLDTEKKG